MNRTQQSLRLMRLARLFRNAAIVAAMAGHDIYASRFNRVSAKYWDRYVLGD